jgi:hypothetical protein
MRSLISDRSTLIESISPDVPDREWVVFSILRRGRLSEARQSRNNEYWPIFMMIGHFKHKREICRESHTRARVLFMKQSGMGKRLARAAYAGNPHRRPSVLLTQADLSQSRATKSSRWKIMSFGKNW